ncbi:MAG: MBL fold metallo-hydrolase [Christensenellaceae bacterium]|nr:MBL fold metallo-hydrolase [Christensenellaceae bacterium]
MLRNQTLGAVYGIETAEGIVLIDCGAPGTGLRQIRESLADWGVEKPITHLLLTHSHFDHAGNAKALQGENVKVIGSKGDLPAFENGGSRWPESPFEDQSYPAFTPDLLIDGDQSLELDGLSLDFIQIPGHTNGAMAIKTQLDGKTLLFTGDALQPSGWMFDEISFGWQGDPNFSRASICKSMLKLSRVECDLILPGHGSICLRDGSAILRQAARQAFLTMR